MAERLRCGLQRGSGFGLVVLDADQYLRRRQHVLHDQRAAQDVVRLGRISMSSQVMKGSHSAPLITSVSVTSRFPGMSFR
jgi:hypothetical protein